MRGGTIPAQPISSIDKTVLRQSQNNLNFNSIILICLRQRFPPTSILSPNHLRIEMTWEDEWHRTMSEFFRLVDLSTEERQILFGNRRVSEVVKGSVESSRNWANRNEELSMGAVVAPDTYAGFVERELPESIPTIIKEHVANLLRYAE